jgi:hypothetical protein
LNFNFKRFVKERDAAFVDFVRTGSETKVRKYCRKYGVTMPKDKKVMAAGIYKAVQECTQIPEEIKVLAMQKCLEIGFMPFIDMERMNKDDGRSDQSPGGD